MTRNMQWMGFLSTVLIMVTLFMGGLREPFRQIQAAEDYQAVAVAEAIDIYAENCVVCHGASGEGLGVYPAITTAGTMDADTLFKTIERGRYDTQMAAYGLDEGGILTNAQVDNLVTMIQAGDWVSVSQRVDELGLTPPEMVVAPITEETLSLVNTLPDGEALGAGLTLYAENCASCHGANGEGSTLAPAVNTPETQANDGFELARIIEQGVPGTLMAGWGNALTPLEIDNLVVVLQRWNELDTLGVEIPVIEAKPLDMSPEAIALGDRLFDITCTSCHGVDGYGSPMAPALNNALFLSETSDTQIHQIIAMGVSGTIMPAWGSRFSEADINAIIAYLRSLESNAPIITQSR
jgi:mono/diheme cytochrome c family protein